MHKYCTTAGCLILHLVDQIWNKALSPVILANITNIYGRFPGKVNVEGNVNHNLLCTNYSTYSFKFQLAYVYAIRETVSSIIT